METKIIIIVEIIKKMMVLIWKGKKILKILILNLRMIRIMNRKLNNNIKKWKNRRELKKKLSKDY